MKFVAFAAVAVGAVIWLAAPASAEAELYCAPSPCAPGTPVATIEQAIEQSNAASATADTVAIQPGTHELANGPCGGTFVTDAKDTIRGAGIDETILTTPPIDPTFGGTRRVICGHMQLADVTLRLQSVVTPGKNASAEGFDLYSGSIERVRVDAEGASFGPDLNDGRGEAGLVRAGMVRNLEVDFDPSADTGGLSLSGGSGETITEISDVEVRSRRHALAGRLATDPADAPTILRGLSLHAHHPLNLINQSGSDAELILSDSVLDASGAPADLATTGLGLGNSFPPDGFSATIDRVTIVGNGAPESAAIRAFGRGVPPTSLNATHLAISGFDHTLVSQPAGGDVDVTIDHSVGDFSASALVTDGPGPGSASTDIGPGAVSADPLLVNPGAGDFRLLHASPAVDIGGAALVPEPANDLRGAVRPTDGDGDGIIATDAGALEHVNNAVKVRRVKRNPDGSAKLRLGIPNAGELTVAGPGIKTVRRTLAGPGRTEVKLVARGAAKRKLRRRGKAKVRVTLGYVPEGGTRGVERVTVELRRKRG